MIFAQNCRAKRSWSNFGRCGVTVGQVAKTSCYARAAFKCFSSPYSDRLLATLADERLRATTEQLCDALGACTELNPVYRRLVNMALEELR